MFIKCMTLTRRLAAYKANTKGLQLFARTWKTNFDDLCVDFKGSKSVLDLPKKPQTAETKAAAYALPRNQPLGIYPKDPRYKKRMFFQQLLCIPDGKLVWQIYPADAWCLYSTILVIFLCSARIVYGMYVISSPKKKKD